MGVEMERVTEQIGEGRKHSRLTSAPAYFWRLWRNDGR
jgi:hypothetical protein